MTPTMEEVAGWHRDLSEWFRSIANMSGMACTNELNLKRAKLWEDRAAQIEVMAYAHKITELHVTELAKAIRDAAVLAGICKDGINLTGPDLIMLCGDMGNAIKSSQVEVMTIIKTCETCINFDVQFNDCLNSFDSSFENGADIEHCGTEFGCIHHEDKQLKESK